MKTVELRRDLLLAAIRCKFLLPEEKKRCPPILFRCLSPDLGGVEREGDLSTAWAFSLSKVSLPAEEIARKIAEQNPNWKAVNGFLNIRLTDQQILAAVNALAQQFIPEKYLFVHPNDSHKAFLQEYCIYRASRSPAAPKSCKTLPEGVLRNLGVLILYADLGGAPEVLAKAVYQYFLQTPAFCPGPWPFAAAEIFARQMYNL